MLCLDAGGNISQTALILKQINNVGYMKGKMTVMYNSNKNVRGMCIIVCTLCETITLNTFAKFARNSQ